ncbi:MAG TPA: fumarylacetoacetate hydrolase family protein [Chitinophagaceae bacterium]|jgi:2-keto-4-pentenoate hydratase/2-oxohepta-3-ene-1,7-dioic acid hydratase in catechol pathway|nr:fumarylacetoacetate hydrolase family protein [Chitinophagaceae bacterium]
MKIFCIGRNYAAHAEELHNEIPKEPVIFMKPKNALLLNNNPFYYPDFTIDLHFECELVLRICKNGKQIRDKYASRYYDQIGLGIDFTARDLQVTLKEAGLPWEKAKAFDHSAVVGKMMDISPGQDLKNINFSLKKNDEIVQQGNSADMLFNFDQVLMHISRYFTVNIGDLVFTGTPAGVGRIQIGDHLEGFMEQEKMLDFEIR